MLLRLTFLISCIILLSPPANAATDDSEYLFNSDFNISTDDVNEGELVFLTTAPDKIPHQVNNTIQINSQSLKDGWARSQQCHTNIDALDNVEITYNSTMTRDLTITSSTHIGKSWVEDGNVELRNIKPHASVCVAYESKTLHFNDDGVILRTGPYMRRFLDGYYPVHVNLKVSYPCKDLHFLHGNFSPQAGYHLTASDCNISLDTLFEGKLVSELSFIRVNKKKPLAADTSHQAQP